MISKNVKRALVDLSARAQATGLAVLLAAACVTCDTAPIEYNEYTIESIATPVDEVVLQKKVYIGHSLPVNVTLTARYTEEDIPLQFYLLNVDDVAYVEKGIGDAEDVRVYYCYQTPHTRIKRLEAGTHTYGLVINIPAEQARDKLTGDFKIGTYYVVADVDANDQAKLDAFEVYNELKERLDSQNTVFIASDYVKKPDLSVTSMNFTGTEEAPHDSITFYELDMSKLPGAQATGLPSFFIKPSRADRTFEGTVDVRSSSADTLNVPIEFFLASRDGSVRVPLEIYDTTLGGFVDEYFIPILRKNTTESVTLQFRVPDDRDGYFFSLFGTDEWNADTFLNHPDRDAYPLFEIFYAMTKEGLIEQGFADEYISVNGITKNESPSRDYVFKIEAVVNPDGKVTESRFIDPNDTNDEYSTDNYLEDGDVYDAANPAPMITFENNTLADDLILRLEKIFVEPNEGAKFYPCSKIAGQEDCDPADGYRQMVIFWGGWGAHVGNNNLWAGFDVWTGIFFRNYSLFSMGINLYGHVSDFVTGGDLVSAQGGYRMSFMSESHPFDADKTFYEFVVLGSVIPFFGAPWAGGEVGWGDESDWWQGSVSLFAFKDESQGFGDYTVSSPITFEKFSIELDTEVAGFGIEFAVRGGFGGIYILPRTDAQLNRDGSLRFDVAATVAMGVEAELSIGALGLISAGVEGSIDIVSFDLGFGALTRVYYDEVNAPGMVKGSIGFGPDLWFIGPQGELKAYVELPLLLAKVRIEQVILSFQAFKLKLYDEPFVESAKTGWVDLARPELVDYSYPDLRIDDGN
jgi:hypothetical protein